MSCANKPVWVVKEPSESGASCSHHLGPYLEMLVQVGRVNFQLFFVELPDGVVKCRYEDLKAVLCGIQVTLEAKGSLGPARQTIEAKTKPVIESKLSVKTL